MGGKTVNWNADEIRVSVFPVGKPGEASSFSVYPSYGIPRTRFVQGLAKRLGSRAFYVRGTAPQTGAETPVMPVSGAMSGRMGGNGTSEGNLSRAADYVSALMNLGMSVRISAGGREYSVSVEEMQAKKDALSTSADSEVASPSGSPSGGEVRRSF